MWLVCIDILKIVNWKCTVSVEIHNNSSLSSGGIMMKSQHNSVLHAFSVPDWSEMCGVVGVLTVLLLLPTQYTAGEIVKMWCQEFDIYLLANIYTYIYIYQYRYHPVDKRYEFSISVQFVITSLLRGFFQCKKKVFQKLAGLWLVGEVVNHVGLYGSKVAEGCSAFQRRSCLLKCSFRRRSKKISKVRVTGLCAGNSPETVEFSHKWPVTRKMFPFDDVIMSLVELHTLVTKGEKYFVILM